jgi:hypothetical protein
MPIKERRFIDLSLRSLPSGTFNFLENHWVTVPNSSYLSTINIYIDHIDALVLAGRPRSPKYIRMFLSSLRSLLLVDSGDCGTEDRDLSLDPSIVSDVEATLETREPFVSTLYSPVPTSEV